MIFLSLVLYLFIGTFYAGYKGSKITRKDKTDFSLQMSILHSALWWYFVILSLGVLTDIAIHKFSSRPRKKRVAKQPKPPKPLNKFWGLLVHPK